MSNSTTPKPDSPKKAPRKNRPKVDPEIARIRKKCGDEVKQYLHRRASSQLLKTLITKRLPKLVEADRQRLLDTLMQNTTPALPGVMPGIVEGHAMAAAQERTADIEPCQCSCEQTCTDDEA